MAEASTQVAARAEVAALTMLFWQLAMMRIIGSFATAGAVAGARRVTFGCLGRMTRSHTLTPDHQMALPANPTLLSRLLQVKVACCRIQHTQRMCAKLQLWFE